jgi:hypothetical protein
MGLENLTILVALASFVLPATEEEERRFLMMSLFVANIDIFVLQK